VADFIQEGILEETGKEEPSEGSAYPAFVFVRQPVGNWCGAVDDELRVTMVDLLVIQSKH